ncbi:MAG: YeeE/YedE family protein [Rhodospirillales bacterium]|nr:YeeE/YedE family protein [Rhodospirillales bacterium]MSP80421.1 YeeE/YedE family protein [Rhodospirillales bacterium]
MEELPVKYVVATLGLALGVVFGATAQKTNFCTMGSISDIVFMGNWNRMRAWLLAIAVAILGGQALHLAGLIDLNKSVYLTPSLGWFGAIVGGALFGFGMTLGGGCGSKTLVRIGGGNLKSLVVALFIAIFGYMTMRGLIATVRIPLEVAVNINLAKVQLPAQGLPDFLAALTGVALPGARLAVAAAVTLGLLWFCFRSAEFRASVPDVAAGLVLGATVPAAWAITGIVGNDPFAPTPLAGLTFVAPVGESVIFLMTFTGAAINFGIATVGGVILGAFLVALAEKSFRIEAFADAGDMGRHMSGGALMGVGGVMAMGCTIGQGLTGISTLALASVLALGSIWAGGYFGMKYLEEGSFGAAARAVFARSA